MGCSDEEVYRKYAPELLRFAATLVGPSAADDVVSSAFLRTVSSARWSQVVEHRRYLYRSVLNEARQHHRSRRRRLTREFAAARRETVAPDELRVDLADSLASLNMQQRAVIHLTYWFDMSVPEVAETLDMSVRTVERNLQFARAHLRRSLR